MESSLLVKNYLKDSEYGVKLVIEQSEKYSFFCLRLEAYECPCRSPPNKSTVGQECLQKYIPGLWTPMLLLLEKSHKT